MQDAIACLSENASSLNDTVRDKATVVEKNRTRHDKNDADNEEEEARIQQLEQDVENLRAKADTMTVQMEGDLRKLLDTREYFNSVRPVLQEVNNEATAFSRTNPSSSTQPQSTQQTRSQRRAAQRANNDDADDVDDDDNDNQNDDDDDEYHPFTPTDPTNALTQSTSLPPAPISLFKTKLVRRRDKYQNLSNRQRYSADNDYRNFRRVLHDSRYGDTDIPLAHESTWFTASGDATLPQPGVTDAQAGAGADDDSDDDLQIAKETISTKCPLTLQEFREPVTSRKCPHSFEKEAILGMIDNPSNVMRVGGSNQRGARDGTRAVQCPVTGCRHTLTRDDLHADPVLLRKIRRIQTANRQAEEDDDDDDDDDDEGESGEQGGRDRPQEIGSGEDESEDGLDVDRFDRGSAKRVKMERMSGRPR